MTIYAMPFQVDLKIKSSGIGGFSDGGVKCLRRDLTGPNFAPVNVDVGPDPGKAWRSFVLSALATASGSVGVANNGSNAVDITEALLLQDGTVLPPSLPTTIGAKAISRIDHSVFAGGDTLGGILSYPQKLRYKLSATSGSPAVAPNGLVRLMLLVQELDLLKDE